MEEKILSAFANPIRLKLILCLSKRSKNVTEMIRICGLSQSAVSQHLMKLKDAGLVTPKRTGKEIYYSLTYPKTSLLASKMENFLKTIKT